MSRLYFGATLPLILLLCLPIRATAGLESLPALPMPERKAPSAECLRAADGTVRALLVGIDHYALAGVDLMGAVNDAELLAAVLKRHQVAVALAPNASRATFASDLTSLAHDSRCGDTAIIFISDHNFSVAGSGLQFAFSDLAADLRPDDGDAYPLVSLEKSSAHRERRKIRGAVDSSELLDYFDGLRDNGVNVVFIADSSNAKRFAGRMGNDFASWHGLQTDPGSRADSQAPKGAYFGIYGGAVEVETKLPPGDPKGAVHGVLTWALAAALSEPGNASFSTFSYKVSSVWDRTLPAGPLFDKEREPPVFESSHPDRSPFATGLPSNMRTGESRLRDIENRHIEVTVPALQRGVAVVGLGFAQIQGRIESSSPPRVVTANQTVGQVYPDGTFQVKLPVVEGENRVLLTAWWNDIDFVPRFFTVVAQNGEKVVQEGQRYALLIGNQDYKNPEFQKLATPIADTHSLAQVLEKRYGFTTTVVFADQPVSLVLDDAERERMLHVLSQLRAVLKPADSLLIYYGGHGVYEKETDRAYWLPVDAARDAPEDWVSDADISAALSRLTARHILVVADSCYAGAFRHRGGEPDRTTMSRIQFLGEVNLRQSRNFLTSGASEPVADEGGNGHSVFARTLLDALSKEKKPFTAGELFSKYIQTDVGGNSKQIPQYFPMKDGHEGGEFVFVPTPPN
jgi:hypothetical protein